MLSRLLPVVLLSAPLLTAKPATVPRTLADADKLEAQLEAKPDDVNTRATLLRFYFFQTTTVTADRARPQRRKHILWLIEHNPEAIVLAESAAARPAANVYANAINFYRTPDPPFARKLIDDGLAAYPGNVGIATAKGTQLAFTILGVKLVGRYGEPIAFDDARARSEEAARARQELESSTSASVLGAAATTISGQPLSMLSQNRTEQMKEAADLSEHLFQRAIELEPKNPRWTTGLAGMYVYWTAALWTSAFPKTGAEKIALMEKALRTVGDAPFRGHVLPELAQAYFAAQGVLIKVTQPVTTFQFIGAQPGRWRVWAIDAAGRPGPKSDWREFSYTR